jgi:membrane peptidoglycan carboxypeptidase
VGQAPVGGTPSGPPGTASSGRARVGGRASVGGDNDSGFDRPSGGRASAGRASVGRDYDSGFDRPSGGRASTGRASVGSASVGSASVGAAGVGRAGRAAVRPVSPGGLGASSFSYGPDDPYGGGAGRGPGGPGGTGPGGRRGRDDRDPEALRRARKRKRINLAIAAFAVFIMLAGAGVVVGTYYTSSVTLPNEVPLPLATTIFASDGKTPIAKVGEVNRSLVTEAQIPQHVQYAVASAEDRKFYEHSGIDYVGIARAAWNNLTGGSTQGASTITQQYARNAFDNLKDQTYARKVREAVLASKLNDRYTKSQIMNFYLNTIYFGRGAYGIEAAAQTYFKKPTDKLTVAEAAVLAAIIKQPVPDSSTGHKGYDPANNPQDALERWNYVLEGMVQKGWLKPQDRPTQYPAVEKPKDDGGGLDFGINTPRGNVVNYVREEMLKMKLCEADTCSKVLKDGGFKVRTTIDPKMQKAVEAAAQRTVKGSVLSTQPKNLMAAVVSIDPTNGRVVAYYGGDSGAGFDYAGKNVDTAGNVSGGHPPGSTFKVYTLAAALSEGISVKSHWDSTPFTVPGTKITVRNAGHKTTSCGKWCSLEESTVKSYNVPFYKITEKIGADKVVEMARRAGITTMWTTSDNPPKPVDLTRQTGKDVTPDPFFNVVGYGQYPVTVLDHANGIATLANRGTYNRAHFVISVEQQNKDTGKWEKVGGEQLKPEQRIRPEVADDVAAVLKQIPSTGNDELDDGRPSAGKTGTWELNETSDHNAHAWMVGYTRQLATAVWVGNVGPKQSAILDKNGNDIFGATVPADIWKRYMDAALKGKNVVDFNPPANIGDPNLGDGKSPAPALPNPVPCTDPLSPLCAPNPNPDPNANPNPNPNPNPLFPPPGGNGNEGNRRGDGRPGG